MRWVEWWWLLHEMTDAGAEVSKVVLVKLVQGYAGCAGDLQADWLVHRLERTGWLQREQRGANPTFRILTPQRSPVPRSPRAAWDQPWDGAWRVVTFDLPEVRRKDRHRLWKALRAARLGLLQRSVWIWPHDVQELLTQIIEATGVPECFCGFKATQLFLCTDAEIVLSAWDFVELTRRQRGYLSNRAATVRQLKATDDLARLAALAREEWVAYEHAFAHDPLLPTKLLPPGYQGAAVERQHAEIRRELRQRLSRLVPG
jgi:phenylacetic acid degradation operon negative regulatory protein